MFKRYTFQIELSCLSHTPQTGEVEIRIEEIVRKAFPTLSLVSIKDVKKNSIHKYRDEYIVTLTSSRNPDRLEPVATNVEGQFQSWNIKELNGN